MKPLNPLDTYKRAPLTKVHDAQEPVTPNNTKATGVIISPNKAGTLTSDTTPQRPAFDPSTFHTSASVTGVLINPAVVHTTMMTKAQCDDGWLMALDAWDIGDARMQ